jgi:ATP-dependent DNA helicase RecQ
MITSFEPALRRSRFPDPIVEAARQHFHIPYLYPIQRFVISNTIEEKNQIVVLPTGGGKSLCYHLPARICSGITLVIVPLLSLLDEQVGLCREAGLMAQALRGGQSDQERKRVSSRARSGGIDVLFTTPEALARVARKQLLPDIEIFHLVVDEAHCVAEWGKSFRPAYLKLQEIIPSLRVRCLTAFTATASPRVLETIREVVFPGRGVTTVAADPDRPNIRYSVIPTLSKARSLRQIVGTSPHPLLIFSRSRSGTEWAARTLRRHLPDLETYFYHAGLNRKERGRIEAWYKHSGEGILTATSAYGMGVDKPDIRTVIHLDIPYSPEAYLQETGRAGRDGRPVQATLLYSPEDLGFAEILNDPLAVERYDQMSGYALDTTRCRREQLLGFLVQEPVSCSGCDVCDGRVLNQAEGAEQILDFVSKNRRRFTMLQAVQVLRGAKSYEVVRRQLASSYGFGLLSDWEVEEIEEALEALCHSGDIKVLKRGLWKQRITLGGTVGLSNSTWQWQA